EESRLQSAGWSRDSWAVVCNSEWSSEKTRDSLRSWWSTASDVAGLALLRLLHEWLCDESVSREPRLHRFVGQLSTRHRVWSRFSPSAECGRAGRVGVSGRKGGR